MRIRDVALTLLAWLLLGWLLRDALYLAYDYLSSPLFKLSVHHPDLGPRLERLRIFAAMAAGLVACLVILTLARYRRARRALPAKQPPRLTIPEQAARLGVEESLVIEARGFKIAVVQVRDDGSISAIENAEICVPPNSGRG
jgi:poly-beta-1,6-N-acetyl-D-glucosamine biosynthesis protein PgaD